MLNKKYNFEMVWNKVWNTSNTYSDERVRDYISKIKGLQIVEYIKREFKENRFEKIAEIGCGDCRVLKFVGEQLNCRELIGIDISKSAIEKAKGLYKNKIVLKLGTATDIPIQDNYCDIVLSLGVIEHYKLKEDMERAVKEMYRVLKPGGVAVIMVPNKISFGVVDRILQQSFRNWMYGFQKELTPEQMRDIVKNCGFSVIKYKVFDFILVPGVKKPLRFYAIKILDSFFKKIIKDCGFYLYTFSKK
ncbi:methyltransferase type 11 [Thermosipho melanesiensis]|uniref:Methyltransferase type 11 n=2 Tax=Thermosipho melanesiensis TaxID=46541 RepID=A6LM16_THEM4|nr:class I SAM-dependent methyltransferase [Thermosipho melanesiensis]ABR30967.1 Methyltransferase type 11 [Thermosipho melanesiensis BI429]APT74068.1 methyltransferase type 11 [Thermosipho melanesiensis]OOC36012.1 methyltransferase type 11 [Thermosipho melanesiensis]OOC38151.1 methyltransferase type 11 [Thermosipho melanesiensis]OOC38280.1 methyltransferase type 11 [Thermosipho melanesiensis]